MNTKRAVIGYSFSANNAGDFALTIAVIDLLVKNNYKVTAISRFRKEDKEFKETNEYYSKNYKDSVKLIESPFYLDREANIIKKTLNNLHGFLIVNGILKNRFVENEIKNSNLVLMGPGNLLRCSSFSDYMRLKALNFPLSIAKSMNVPYLIMPQSSSEINKMGYGLLNQMMGNAKTVFVRENLSYVKLKKLFPNANIVETIDSAFFLLNENHFKKFDRKLKKIAFTIRIDGIGGLRKFTTQEKDKIKVAIKNFCSLNRDNFEFTFVVQAPIRDREFTKELMNEINDDLKIETFFIENHDPIELIKIYSNFDLLIGMRLHSIILAACAGTPSFGLFFKEWGLKNPGIMNSIKLPYAFLDDKNDIDINSINNIINNRASFQNDILNLYRNESIKFLKTFESIL